jgi:hypothetical protein
MRRVSLGLSTLLLVLSLTASPALARRPEPAASGADGAPAGANDTYTWWCVDLSAIWHADAPVIIGRSALVPPAPAPIPDPCPVAFPVSIPYGSPFASGAAWITNKTYPPAIRDALQAMGYDFASESPAEDFLHKLVQVRLEVREFGDDGSGAPVAVYVLDPRRSFRMIRARDYFGQLPLEPIADPALGVDISADELGRLPDVAFPAPVGPVPPGHYRLWTWWTFSALHNDGTGLTDGNFLPAGDFLYGFPPFFVLPP